MLCYRGYLSKINIGILLPEATLTPLCCRKGRTCHSMQKASNCSAGQKASLQHMPEVGGQLSHAREQKQSKLQLSGVWRQSAFAGIKANLTLKSPIVKSQQLLQKKIRVVASCTELVWDTNSWVQTPDLPAYGGRPRPSMLECPSLMWRLSSWLAVQAALWFKTSISNKERAQATTHDKVLSQSRSRLLSKNI